jgi:hypothetical protein
MVPVWTGIFTHSDVFRPLENIACIPSDDLFLFIGSIRFILIFQ